jgi:hypothetical protein
VTAVRTFGKVRSRGGPDQSATDTRSTKISRSETVPNVILFNTRGRTVSARSRSRRTMWIKVIEEVIKMISSSPASAGHLPHGPAAKPLRGKRMSATHAEVGGACGR